jgi:hypothetical protein
MLAGLAAGGALVEDAPTAKPPKPGALHGRIANADQVKELSAVSRVTGTRYAPQTFDRKAGSFAFKDLPGDACYDLCITTADGRRIEGIDLNWFEARLLRLAETRAKELGVPSRGGHAFTGDDAEELVRFVASRKEFHDVNRLLFVRGLGDKAVALAERIRAREFYDSRAGEAIWRTDLWYFTFDAGGWQQVPNVERRIERHQFLPEDWGKFTLVYEAALSGYVDPDGRSSPIDYTVPKDLDPAKGRIAGAQLRQDTHPVVLGMAPGAAPATRPAGTQSRPASL